MESSDVFWKDRCKREHGRYRQLKMSESRGERERGGKRESLLDLQSLIDRLFIDLV